jgi:hypothetical protein
MNEDIPESKKAGENAALRGVGALQRRLNLETSHELCKRPQASTPSEHTGVVPGARTISICCR